MRVAIVGAGICGLSAARALKKAGAEAVVFEKSRGVGGRVATRRTDGFVWDTGATSIAPRGKAIERVMLEELDTTDLVRVELPIYLHHALRPTAGDARRHVPRYTYRTGNVTLPKLLAKDADVRTESQVDEILRDGERFIVRDEPFDGVILTPPVPQTSLLLYGLQESRPLAAAVYRSCLSVNLGFEAPLPATAYHALLEAEHRHPLTWLSLESVKSPGRAPEGGSALGAQMSPAFTLANFRRSDDELVEIVGEFTSRLFGAAFAKPTASTVMRWKYSQPTGYASFDEVNPTGTRIVVASDGLLGGHVEDAFEVGLRAAAHFQ